MPSLGPFLAFEVRLIAWYTTVDKVEERQVSWLRVVGRKADDQPSAQEPSKVVRSLQLHASRMSNPADG